MIKKIIAYAIVTLFVTSPAVTYTNNRSQYTHTNQSIGIFAWGFGLGAITALCASQLYRLTSWMKPASKTPEIVTSQISTQSSLNCQAVLPMPAYKAFRIRKSLSARYNDLINYESELIIADTIRMINEEDPECIRDLLGCKDLGNRAQVAYAVRHIDQRWKNAHSTKESINSTQASIQDYINRNALHFMREQDSADMVVQKSQLQQQAFESLTAYNAGLYNERIRIVSENNIPAYSYVEPSAPIL